jgi:TolB-like protein
MDNFYVKSAAFFFLTISFLGACVSMDSNVESISLDNAIQKAANNIENSLDPGTIVAVLNFSSDSESFSKYVIDEMTLHLTNGKKLVIVNRDNLDLIRREMGLQLSGDVSDESIRSIGKFLGAQSIVTGSVQKIGNLYRIRFNTINVETAVSEAASSFYLNKNDRQAAALLTENTDTSIQNSLPSDKSSYFLNNGGSGIILALLGLNQTNLSQDELWILNYLQGSIDSIFKRYSNVLILDRSPEGLQRRTDEINYQYENGVDDNELAFVGGLRAAHYVIVGTVTKNGNSEYSIQLRIVHVETGVQNATYTLICSLEQIRNTTATRRLLYELLTQMGVIFTTNGRKAILEEI